MKTLIDTPPIECPNHNGSFDCTPFCRLCEGEQETTLDEIVAQAYSLSWDGCHKLYLNMDEAQHEKIMGYGYDLTIINRDPAVTMDKIEEWYNDSCSLRFIDAVFTNDDETDKFVTIVPQFFLEEEDDA